MTTPQFAFLAAFASLAATPALAQGFGPAWEIDSSNEPIADLDVADLNGDGWNDIVVSTSTGFFGGGLYVYLATAPGIFAKTPSLAFGDVCTTEAVDLDGDGDVDLVCNWDGLFCPELVWFENDGSGTSFTQRGLVFCSNDSNTCAALEVFDQDGDGDLDIAATALGGVVFLEQTAPGSFALIDTLADFGLQPASLASGDFDGDGARELVAARRTPGGAFSEESWHLRALNQDPQGIWQAGVWTAVEAAASQATWILGATGPEALVVHDPQQGRLVLVEDPLQATAQTAVPWLTAAGEVGALSTSDLDGDGDSDLMFPWIEREEVVWLPNLGSSAAPPRAGRLRGSAGTPTRRARRPER
jgi:hypothetical protein